MKMKSWRAAVTIVTLASLLLAFSHYLFALSDRNLTHIAKRLPSPSPQIAPADSQTLRLGGDRLLVTRIDSKGFTQCNVIDMHSGSSTPLPNLNELYRNVRYPMPGELSPDGQWLLYYQTLSSSMTHEFFAVRLDGSQVVRCKQSDDNSYQKVWSGDSKGGAVIDYVTGRLRRWRLSDPVLRPVTNAHSSANQMGEGFAAIGPIEGGYLTYRETAIGSLQFIRIGEQGRKQIIGTARIPRDGACTALSLSPSGRKLLWVVHYAIKPSRFAWIRKINEWLHKDLGSFDSLHTSDIDGSDLHEVGSVPADYDLGSRNRLQHVDWKLDEKTILFDYDGSTWTVPAEP